MTYSNKPLNSKILFKYFILIELFYNFKMYIVT